MDNRDSLRWPIALDGKQEAKLARFHSLLVEWNERMNLTAIVELREVYVKHFFDSLAVANLPAWTASSDRPLRVIDVGTGAGFPGIPLAIAYPNRDFVLCDALGKRIRFLQTVCDELGLENVKCIHARSEDLARQDGFRASFDVAVSRAVARMNVLMEYMAPFLRVEGLGICYKGPSLAEDEEADAVRAAKVLHARLATPFFHYALPEGMGERSLVVFRQESLVPNRFPRKAGVVQRQPL